MRTRMVVVLALTALVHAKATMVGYAQVLSVLPYLSKTGEFFKDPAFLFGLVALMGILVLVLRVLEIGFSLLAPAGVTVLLFWVVARALKDHLSLDHLYPCSAVVGVFSVLSVLGLLAFGADQVSMEDGATALISFTLLSALCTGYLIWRLSARTRPKVQDANAA